MEAVGTFEGGRRVDLLRLPSCFQANLTISRTHIEDIGPTRQNGIARPKFTTRLTADVKATDEIGQCAICATRLASQIEQQGRPIGDFC